MHFHVGAAQATGHVKTIVGETDKEHDTRFLYPTEVVAKKKSKLVPVHAMEALGGEEEV
jgi:hypothetical protein